DKEMIQEKIGEALGLEKAAQKGVEELESRGLLKPEHMKKLSKMKEEASRQEQQMEELVQQLTESDELDSEKIESTADETAEKASKIMETYLGEDPDPQEVRPSRGRVDYNFVNYCSTIKYLECFVLWTI
ncbi:MAG TPA: hypothetical protein VNB67_06825, partial [Nitrososphaeraceae archaeon]|nr:hypothetical protein [Nitrososphaeraceae archaeon]